ncbi:type II toxin-antitoxin system RelE family toxin [Methanobrevibacter filiformis]|uniref:Plasmid stabilization system protein n=1 Tax=Methanobrevibacter filiformis TaxID=55758 RepID=A0A166C0J1_9EURY|nr:type II toxin-antitoxin system RelE/ParE family toxin [Methanobrevibacter filiformis]KZX10357.1 hypothetical protein MBFIL_17880 [Methanobrevibacter filiformis]
MTLRNTLDYDLEFTRKAEKYIQKLVKKDEKSARKILKSIKEMVEKPYEYSILKGNFNKVHKIRVGNYRILFDIIENKSSYNSYN